MEIRKGTASKIIQIVITAVSSGDGKTGIDQSKVSASYIRPGDVAATAITLDASAGVTLGTYKPTVASHGAIKEVNAATLPGVYEFHIPNNCLSAVSGVDQCLITITDAGDNDIADTTVQIDLVGIGNTSLFEKVVGLVKDDSGKLVNPDDYDRIILAAISLYSKHRPATEALDITGNGTNDYAVSLLTGWTDEFSTIKSIEYPIDEVPAEYLEAEDYDIFQKPAGKVLRLNADSPAATESFRVTFTILRTDTTIPDSDINAFCHLAASLCLEELANAFTQSSDSTIGADSVNYRSKGSEFASRAKAFMKLYKEHLGINDDDITPAAAAVSDLDLKYPGGVGRLTHPRRARERR